MRLATPANVFKELARSVSFVFKVVLILIYWHVFVTLAPAILFFKYNVVFLSFLLNTNDKSCHFIIFLELSSSVCLCCLHSP